MDWFERNPTKWECLLIESERGLRYFLREEAERLPTAIILVEDEQSFFLSMEMREEGLLVKSAKQIYLCSFSRIRQPQTTFLFVAGTTKHRAAAAEMLASQCDARGRPPGEARRAAMLESARLAGESRALGDSIGPKIISFPRGNS